MHYLSSQLEYDASILKAGASSVCFSAASQRLGGGGTWHLGNVQISVLGLSRHARTVQKARVVGAGREGGWHDRRVER